MSKGMDKLYLGTLGFALALSSIVKWEPAVYDILMVILIGWGAAVGYFSIKSIPKWPILFLSILIIPNIIFVIFHGQAAKAMPFFIITLYVVLTWLFFVLILDHFKVEGFRYVLYGYTVSALASAVAGLTAFVFNAYSYLCNGLIYQSPLLFGGFRVMGLFKDPNVFGPYLIPVVIFSLAALWQASGKKKVFWGAVFVICNLGVLSSFGRAAVLNEFLALAVFLILFFCKGSDQNLRQLKQVITAGIIVTIIIAGSLWTNNLLGKILLYRAGFHDYDSERFAAYRQALHLTIENPWGIGPGQTLTKLPIDTHNTYLRVSLENGWPGIIGLMGFLILSIYNAGRMAMHRHSRFGVLYVCVSAALIGILANSMFVDTLHWRHFWILLALAWVDFDLDSSASTWF